MFKLGPRQATVGALYLLGAARKRISPTLHDSTPWLRGLLLRIIHLFRSRLPATSFKPCLPRFARTPPPGPGWIHEIKHDGFRVLARRDGEKFRLISRNGNDLTYRFPSAVQALVALPMRSSIIDGEVIVSDSTGLADFSLISGYRNGHCATLCAFDLIELDGQDLRWQPIEDRKAALKKLIGSKKHPGIAFNKYFDVEGSIVPASSDASASCRSVSARRIGLADRTIRSRTRHPRR